MSHTHYWKWNTSIDNNGRFVQWSRDVRILLAHYSSYAHWYGQYMSPYPILDENKLIYKICGPAGNEEPVISDVEVAFNGNEELESASEPFSITLEDVQAFPFNDGCQTSYNPYDIMVTASLIRLHYYFPEISLFSSSGAGGFQHGTHFCCDIFGSGKNSLIEAKLPIYEQNMDELEKDANNDLDTVYLPYILAWYKHLHPSEAIRYATVRERVCIEASSHHDSEHPLFFDIVNDTYKRVWVVRTGSHFKTYIPKFGRILYGSDFPALDYIADEAARLQKQWKEVGYQLGVSEIPVKSENILSDISRAYFHDGSIMNVKIPLRVERKNGTIIPVRGIIEYSIIRTKAKRENTIYVVNKEEYQNLYNTTGPEMEERFEG